MRFLNSRTLRYFGQRARELAHNFENAHHPYEERQGVGRLLSAALAARQGGAFHPRGQLYGVLFFRCVRQGRDHRVGGPKDRLSHASPRFPRLRASRLPSRRLGLVVRLQPVAREVSVYPRQAARNVESRETGQQQRSRSRLGGHPVRSGQAQGLPAGAGEGRFCPLLVG